MENISLNNKPSVLILIGSESDFVTIQEAKKIFIKFDIKHEIHIASAHRSPLKVLKLTTEAESKGIKIIIAAAGMAAHLAGVVASKTTLPVIGVPIPGGALNGVDALYSTVQMPGGIPVASMAIGKAGAKNAALFAIQILALQNPDLTLKMKEYRTQMEQEVEKQDANIQTNH